jgi:hypothetical protein
MRAMWNQRLDGRDAPKPKPFPGKYPTRLAYEIRFSGGRTESYCGKPSKQAVERLFALQQRRRVRFSCVVEFDRERVVTKVSTWGPWDRQDRDPRTETCRILGYVYHPFRTDGLRMFLRPWWLKKVGGKVLYSPHKVLKLQEHVLTYKARLKEMGL